MFLIDTKNKKATQLEKMKFSELNLTERNDLQEWIVNTPEMLGEDLLIIQKEFSGFENTNERLDLLALDKDRRLVIIENKLDDSGKDVVWQALKYASYCATLTESEIYEIYQRYTHEDARENIAEFYNEQDYENLRLNSNEGDQRIILVAANFRKEVTSTVLWLRNYHGVDIKCIKVTPYKDGDKLYLDTEQIIPIQDAGDYQVRIGNKKQTEAIKSMNETTRLTNYYHFHTQLLLRLGNTFDAYKNHEISTQKPWLPPVFKEKCICITHVVLRRASRVEIYIWGGQAQSKNIFNKLFAQKDAIEKSCGFSLDWQALPTKGASRICTHLDYGITDTEHWDDIIEFLAKMLTTMEHVFRPLLEKI